MVGRFLHLTNTAPMKDSYQERKVKAEAIRHTLLTIPRGNVYVETNSNFIRTFYDVVIEEFPDAQIYVVVLRRYMAEILKSLLELGHFAGNPAAENFIPAPDSVTNAVRPCWTQYDKPDRFDKLIHYLVDTEGRARRFKSEYNNRMNIKIIDVEIKDLMNIHRINKLFSLLKIESTKETEKAIGVSANLRLNVKKQYPSNVTMEMCEKRIKEYLGRCTKLNIAVPDLPHNILTSMGPSTWL